MTACHQEAAAPGARPGGPAGPHLRHVRVRVDLEHRQHASLLSPASFSQAPGRSITGGLLLTDITTVFSWWTQRVLKHSLDWRVPALKGRNRRPLAEHATPYSDGRKKTLFGLTYLS